MKSITLKFLAQLKTDSGYSLFALSYSENLRHFTA